MPIRRSIACTIKLLARIRWRLLAAEQVWWSFLKNPISVKFLSRNSSTHFLIWNDAPSYWKIVRENLRFNFRNGIKRFLKMIKLSSPFKVPESIKYWRNFDFSRKSNLDANLGRMQWFVHNFVRIAFTQHISTFAENRSIQIKAGMQTRLNFTETDIQSSLSYVTTLRSRKKCDKREVGT